MTGLVWFVQIVHYPLFAAVGEAAFPAHHAAHSTLTIRVVAPTILVEAVTAVLLVWRPPTGVSPVLPWMGVVLLVAIWLSTAFLQVPRHRELAAGFDARALRSLVRSNWLRTAGWTARSAIVLAMIAQTVG